MFLVCGEALFDLFAEATPVTACGSTAGSAALRSTSPSAWRGSAGRRRCSRDCRRTSSASALPPRSLADGVVTGFLLRKDVPTTLSLVGLAADGTPSYAFYGRGAADRSVEVAEIPPMTPEVGVIHFGSYSLVVIPTADAFAALAAREARRRLITLDPNVRLNVEPDLEVWRARVQAMAAHADLIKVSGEDLEAMYPGRSVEATVERWLAAGVRLVVVTRGAEGATGIYARARVIAPASGSRSSIRSAPAMPSRLPCCARSTSSGWPRGPGSRAWRGHAWALPFLRKPCGGDHLHAPRRRPAAPPRAARAGVAVR